MPQELFMSPTRVHTGSCVCEAVKYSLTGPPDAQYLCHCRRCQRSGGSAFASNCFWKRASFKVTAGEDKMSVYHCDKTTSGNMVHRHFCSQCGTPLFILPESRPDDMVVVGGSLDDYDELVPQKEFWVGSRAPWMTPVEGTRCFEQHMGGRPAANKSST